MKLVDIIILKKKFSSSSLTSLQKSAELEQKWPLLNLVRQVLKSCNYLMKPIRQSAGYDKEGKKKDKYGIYGEREKLLITQASDIISSRKKERENLKNQSRKKETMSDVVDQKKEIFSESFLRRFGGRLES